ncbi:MAG: hypothetical protein GWO24_27290, partial [Akkermansiaceae bacterium]|nr:hypothetical protein [Akkermansiaceae bacterium]
RKVSIPRYDSEKRRAALVQAGVLEVISEERVTGEDIELRLFSKKDQETLRVLMDAAEYSRETGILEARRVITVAGENVKAHGAG